MLNILLRAPKKFSTYHTAGPTKVVVRKPLGESTRSLLCAVLLIMGLAACGSAPEFKGVKATTTHVELTVSSVNSGTVRAEREAELAFGTVGRVSRNDAHVGVQVKKDTILAELENLDLATAYETSRNDVERSKDLIKSRTISIQQVEAYKRTFDLARAAYEKSLIRAPFDGLITEVNLEIGQLSQITAILTKPLVKIVDLNPRYVEAEIDEVDLPKLSVGLSARIKVLAVRREPFAGTIRRIVSYVSTIREQDRTSLIELDIDSEGILFPSGASADIEIVAVDRSNVLAVPSRAVLGRGDDRYVFRFINGRSAKTPVVVGIGNYDRIEITSGLSEGDIVLYPSETTELEDGQKVVAKVQPWPS